MRMVLTTMLVGGLSALLLPGALALIGCLLWIHLRRYRHLHGRVLATLWPLPRPWRDSLAPAGPY